MGFQGEHLRSVATDDNHCIEIKASVLYLLTPENIIRGSIEMSAADGKELFPGELGNHRGLETQSPGKSTLENQLPTCGSGLAFPAAAILIS